ncbi:hypothetical protein UFOVP380_45 [uncultured Caudovirales phage]|uniref:Uncharacterized protein n=1 Tax=uncultured Caudovirales phage TaxID=2100421 RepID=A0A6J7WZD9_9CAUD|nr:hypothetical protein UFOVP380_45 [uncultured Caudovirales phage]
MERPEKITNGLVAAAIVISKAPERGKEATLNALEGLAQNAEWNNYSNQFMRAVSDMYYLYLKEGEGEGECQ